MANAQTIGQRDLEFYLACVETERDSIRRCDPALEEYFEARMRAAEAVVAALVIYNALTHTPQQ